MYQKQVETLGFFSLQGTGNGVEKRVAKEVVKSHFQINQRNMKEATNEKVEIFLFYMDI